MTKKQHQRVKTKLDQSFKLKKIVPITETQLDVFEAYNEKFNLFLYGCAGTGKTFISLYLALREVLVPSSSYEKICIIRSAVPTRDVGFLPGKLDEKLAVYESPYNDMFSELFGRGDAFCIAKQKGIIEIISTSFLRGATLRDCIVIADEVQNCSFQELDTIITRIGANARLILCGDVEQCDLIKSKFDQTGVPKFMRILERMESFEFVEFEPGDVVRSGIVKDYLAKKRQLEHAHLSNESQMGRSASVDLPR